MAFLLLPQNLYYICNESALNELRKSWGEEEGNSSTNGQETTSAALQKTLEDSLNENPIDEAALDQWVKVSGNLFSRPRPPVVTCLLISPFAVAL